MGGALWKVVVTAAATGAAVGVAEAWLAGVRRALAARERDAPEQPADRATNGLDAAPSVSVIVPAWNERSTIGPCIESLAAVDYPGAWEVIVLAGGTDGTLELARHACRLLARGRVMEQRPLGKPAALNAGVAVAIGDVVVIVDADTRVAPGWLRALVAPLDAGVRATTGAYAPTVRTWVSRAELMTRIDVYDVRRAPILQGSGTIAIERELLRQIGGFPVDAFADDWELDARLAELGVGRGYAAEARVTTERPATLGEYWRNEIRWRRAHLRSIARAPQHFLRSPISAIRELYPYVSAWGAAVATAAALAAASFGPSAMRGRVLAVWALVAGVVVLRPVGLVLEVLAYSRDPRWLRDAFAPSALFLVTLAASLVATVTPGRATLHFKGPRRGGR